MIPTCRFRAFLFSFPLCSGSPGLDAPMHSQGSLPSYAEVPLMSEPQRRQSRIPIPPYTPPESPKPPLPVSLAHRMASRSRSHSRPPTEFVKQGKNLVLRLAGVQVPGTELPVYGLGAAVEGTLELTKPEGITSIEVKVRGHHYFFTMIKDSSPYRSRARFSSRKSQRVVLI